MKNQEEDCYQWPPNTNLELNKRKLISLVHYIGSAILSCRKLTKDFSYTILNNRTLANYKKTTVWLSTTAELSAFIRANSWVRSKGFENWPVCSIFCIIYWNGDIKGGKF